MLTVWLLVHLLFALLEIVTTPLYPWDAMTVWAYRAKAWFLSGGVFEFMAPEVWLQSGPDLTYTVPASGYPLLPSLIPYWAAVSLGAWHEALVNTPVWLCGAAIVMGFHGQCRSLGLTPLAATAFSYVLVSTPLLGVHLSLAGYADIWMAGFAGLGLICLLRGLPNFRIGQIALGFTLLLLGLLVKNEGLVWLFAGVLLFPCVRLPGRILAATALAAILAAGALALAGWTWFDLPWVGSVGYQDGVLHLPLAGAQTVEVHAVGGAFLRNAFMSGTWNLAWVLMTATLVAALIGPAGREKRAVLSFLAIFLASQAAIFVFSEAGAWARDNTAINRLPLQAWPALLFAAAMTFRRSLESVRPAGGIGHAPRLALGAFAMAGLLALAGAAAWLYLDQPDERAATVGFDPARLKSVVGGGRQTTDGMVVDGYANGLVLLSSGPVDIDADSHFLLRLELESDPGLAWPEEAPAFFWRTREDPGVVSRVTLDGSALVDLTVTGSWRGRITEFGLLFPEHAGRPAVLKSLSLGGRTLASDMELLPRQWFEFEPWTQRSTNALYGGAPDQAVPLNLLVSAWVATALLLVVLLRGRLHGQFVPSLALILLLGWMLLDVRWTANRARQAERSWLALTTSSVDERIVSSYLGKYQSWTGRVRDELIDTGPARLILVRDPAEYEFYAWHARYQLLPHAALVKTRLGRDVALENVDYVVFLGEFAAAEGVPSSPGQRLERLPMSRSWVGRLELVDLSAQGALFRVRKTGDEPVSGDLTGQKL